MDQQDHDGCRCRECWGLAEYMLATTGRDHGLPRAPGHITARLDELDAPACDHTLTCPCATCQQERVAAIHRQWERRRKPPRQPWEARAA